MGLKYMTNLSWNHSDSNITRFLLPSYILSCSANMDIIPQLLSTFHALHSKHECSAFLKHSNTPKNYILIIIHTVLAFRGLLWLYPGCFYSFPYELLRCHWTSPSHYLNQYLITITIMSSDIHIRVLLDLVYPNIPGANELTLYLWRQAPNDFRTSFTKVVDSSQWSSFVMQNFRDQWRFTWGMARLFSLLVINASNTSHVKWQYVTFNFKRRHRIVIDKLLKLFGCHSFNTT